ncbi:unnamed protein product [Euphydryas editha]|uniref:Uncharacterized protein n=1 Tax=Euphydryas editha TaxID=104508 RepID=A0AAU9UY62_EUPED|nr:unnamed protein product [Euphydryas editha]
MEVLDDISITSLSEAELGRKYLYSEGSECSATKTVTGAAAGGRSQTAAKSGKAHTLTGARVARREQVERGREEEFEAFHYKRAYMKEMAMGGSDRRGTHSAGRRGEEKGRGVDASFRGQPQFDIRPDWQVSKVNLRGVMPQK